MARAKGLADDTDARYLAHHAEAHPVGVTLPGTDNDRAPSHRKPPLPPAAGLASRLRAGEGIEALGVEYQRTSDTLRRKISAAGFNGKTGQPRRDRWKHDSDGLAIPMHAWSFPDWIDQALCAQTDPEAFFPDKGGSTREAKAVCAVCPVRLKCLQWALERNERAGIWGGLTERERRNLEKAS